MWLYNSTLFLYVFFLFYFDILITPNNITKLNTQSQKKHVKNFEVKNNKREMKNAAKNNLFYVFINETDEDEKQK